MKSKPFTVQAKSHIFFNDKHYKQIIVKQIVREETIFLSKTNKQRNGKINLKIKLIRNRRIKNVFEVRVDCDPARIHVFKIISAVSDLSCALLLFSLINSTNYSSFHA